MTFNINPEYIHKKHKTCTTCGEIAKYVAISVNPEQDPVYISWICQCDVRHKHTWPDYETFLRESAQLEIEDILRGTNDSTAELP